MGRKNETKVQISRAGLLAPQPQRSLQRVELLIDAERALSQCPMKVTDRYVFELYINGYSYWDIARRTNRSLVNVEKTVIKVSRKLNARVKY